MPRRKQDALHCPVCGSGYVTVDGGGCCPRCARSRIETCRSFHIDINPFDRRIVRAGIKVGLLPRKVGS